MSADAEPSLSAATGLTTALYARVKAEITALRLPPGAALQEAALGLRFSVSRTPVREVLQHLLRDGLVERHGRFYRVIQLTAPEVQALCEVREALECMALGLAFERDPGMRDDLQHLIAGQDAALGRDDFDLFSALYGQFHLRIAEGACNASLLQHFVMLQDKVALVRGMEQQRPFWRTRAVQDHNRIVDALARNTAEIAVGELRYHIRSVAGLRAAAWAAQRVAAV